MEHIIITDLGNGKYRLEPETGFLLFHQASNATYSVAVVKSAKGFSAIPIGVSPEPHERTLADAINERLALLRAYDQSDAVLSFKFDGKDMWLNPQQRTNYLMTINAAEDMGMSAVPFGGQEVPISQARIVLNMVALYAMQVMAVTDAHEAAIKRKKKIETVDAYDYTAGYPEKLVF